MMQPLRQVAEPSCLKGGSTWLAAIIVSPQLLSCVWAPGMTPMHMCRLIQARAIHVLVHWRRRLPRHWARHNWHSQ